MVEAPAPWDRYATVTVLLDRYSRDFLVSIEICTLVAEPLEPDTVGSDPSIQAGSGLRCGRYRGRASLAC